MYRVKISFYIKGKREGKGEVDGEREIYIQNSQTASGAVSVVPTRG